MQHSNRANLLQSLLNFTKDRQSQAVCRQLKRKVFCPERLEERALLATTVWNGKNGGNWSVASNWVGGKVLYFVAFIIVEGLDLSAFAQDTHGLNAQYYKGQEFQEYVVTQTEPNIDWYWGDGAPHARMPKDHFSVKWSGWLKSPQPSRCKLVVLADDGFRLKLDGETIIDQWTGGFHRASANVVLTGQPQRLEVEYFEINLGSVCKLAWQFPNQNSPITIPTEALFVDLPNPKPIKKASKRQQIDRFAQGLLVEYFKRDGKLIGQALSRRSSMFWGDWPPLPGAPHDFKARVSGIIVPPTTGEYRFTTFADDKLKVWINGQPVIDAAFATGPTEGRITLTDGISYTILMEFDDSGRGACFYLNWIPPHETTEQVIPFECLFPTEADFRAKQKSVAPPK